MEEDDFDKYKSFLRINKFSKRTIDSYIHYNRNFLILANKSARAVVQADIVKYLDYLALELNASASTLNLAYSALKSYYGRMYKRRFFIDLPRAKKEKKLPVVLSRNEVLSMIRLTENPKHKTILSLMYGTGMRVSELSNLKMGDIDVERRTMNIRQGKGAKDRIAMLPRSLLLVLANQKLLKDRKEYLFTGYDGRSKLTTATIGKVVKQAAKRAGVNKNVSAHTLRHSFATHQLVQGTNIRYIQAMLGHARLETTQIYTKVSGMCLEEIPDLI